MHEMSLMQGIMAAAAEALKPYRVRRVTAVTVRAGMLANIMPGALSFAFEMQSEGTPFAGASFQLEVAPLTARCRDCGCEYESSTLPPMCPQCHSFQAEILSGGEVLVESIDFEECEEQT